MLPNNRIKYIFESQKVFHPELKKSNAIQRIEKLRKLKAVIKQNEALIYSALQRDLRKSEFEAAVTELIITYSEIDYAIKHLKSWTSPRYIGKSLSNFFAKNRIYYEPKGVCLIIAPWNYPFQLVMAPLISAIAAGNCVMVKPSEISANTSAVVAKILLDTFEEEEVACVEGPASVSTELLTLPFDHIFFTGSTEIGKVVMTAAAKNLTSVTLELGGKSPAIIDQSADLKNAAKKLAWGKLVNSGQTCIAPDYVLIQQNKVDEFIGYYKQFATDFYFKSAEEINEKVYGKIVSKKHFGRLLGLVDDAVSNGAKLNWGGKWEESTQTIYPVILTNLSEKCAIMQEEIFGPILPIITYNSMEEAISFVNQQPKPLALYIFSESNRTTDKIITETSAGGTCVNDVLIHLANPKMPFGGVNHSGMGASHGIFGFKNFSHERAVLKQRKLDFNDLIYPPYEGKNWVLKMLEKIM